MNQSELVSYLILLGIKKLGSKQAIPYRFSYNKTEKKMIYVNRDKLIVRTYILDTDTALMSNNSLITEYHYPITVEQLKEILV